MDELYSKALQGLRFGGLLHTLSVKTTFREQDGSSSYGSPTYLCKIANVNPKPSSDV